MVSVYDGDNFASLRAHIERLEERGETTAADALRRHLAKLEAMKFRGESAKKPHEEAN